jgi:hypothetical protein
MTLHWPPSSAVISEEGGVMSRSRVCWVPSCCSHQYVLRYVVPLAEGSGSDSISL